MPLRAGPGAHRCDVGALARDYGLAYMDVGEGREQGAEAFPAHAALQSYAPDSCRASIELIKASHKLFNCLGNRAVEVNGIGPRQGSGLLAVPNSCRSSSNVVALIKNTKLALLLNQAHYALSQGID